MQDILVYLVFILLGVGLGVLVRKKRGNTGPISVVSAVKSISICTLLFVMSTRIGSNEDVANNLGTIGVYGFVFTIIVMVMTLITAFAFRKMLGFNAHGGIGNAINASSSSSIATNEYFAIEKNLETSDSTEKEEETTKAESEKSVVDQTTVFILVFVVLGILCGHFLVNRIFDDYDVFVKLSSMTINIGLSTLLFLVGFDLGYEESGMGDFKSAGIKIAFFPIATIVGTLIGGVIASFLMPVTMRESLAIASGFGWYSLAPVIIMDAGHVTASAISFLHNVLRELLTILFVPLIAKYVGYIEASCVPGAPGMDICLPIVERSTNGTIAIYSFINGAVTSALVPILVSIFIVDSPM